MISEPENAERLSHHPFAAAPCPAGGGGGQPVRLATRAPRWRPD